MNLSNLFPLEDLADALEQGYVRRQTHPTLPLSILNYSERAQYERFWTAVTLNCRGLIVDDSNEIVARPWAKFFNHGEADCPPLDLQAKAVVVDKLDGSLGVIHPAGNEWAVATRGSFTSEQAIHATEVLRSRYASFQPPEGMTVLCEILYPANRIVCDYGTFDDLVLLGGVDIATGAVVGPADVPDWPGPRAEVFGAGTLAEALALPPRPGAEGVVIRLVDTGTMTKLKQTDYVELHRLVTGLNARVVWERIGAGESVQQICEPLPDEFHGWVKDVADDLQSKAAGIEELARAEHEQIMRRMPDGWARKDYAKFAVNSGNRAWLFMLLDGKDPAPKIWQTLRPSGDVRPVNVSEDVA